MNFPCEMLVNWPDRPDIHGERVWIISVSPDNPKQYRMDSTKLSKNLRDYCMKALGRLDPLYIQKDFIMEPNRQTPVNLPQTPVNLPPVENFFFGKPLETPQAPELYPSTIKREFF